MTLLRGQFVPEVISNLVALAYDKYVRTDIYLSIHLHKSFQNGKYCFADKVQCRL